jgi:regulator of sigma E protease
MPPTYGLPCQSGTDTVNSGVAPPSSTSSTSVQILIAIAGLAFLILIHEGGHFWAARAVGIRVERFSLFFGPAIVHWQRKGVDWKLGSIPLGGYVKLAGTRRLDTYLLREMLPHLSSSGQARLPDLITAIERCHDSVEATTLVDEVAELLAGEDIGPIQRSRVDVYIADARERIFPGAWWLSQPWRRVVTGLAGPVANIVLAFFLLMGAFMIGGAGGKSTTTIGAILPGSSAAKAGLVAGDRITQVEGQRATVKNLISTLTTRGGNAVKLGITHGGREQVYDLSPTYDRTTQRWVIGVAFKQSRVYYGAWPAAKNTFGLMTGATSSTASLTAQALQGDGAASGQLVGPIGVVRLSASSITTDPRTYPGILALLSLSLALLNLLPILPLDGGQILLALIEGLRRGRRMAPTTEAAMMMAGMGIVLLLMMVSLGNDFTHPN